MTIGKRLREERERLGMSQPAFASLAGTTKQTLFSWETGKTAPDGFQMAALAAADVDVLYVVTGQRSQPVAALPPRQRALLDNYEHTDEQGKKIIEAAASAAAKPCEVKAERGSKKVA